MRWHSEPAWIVAGFLAIAAFLVLQPLSVTPGRFLLALASLFLLHTLVRDLVLLWKLRRQTGDESAPRRARCFCVETGAGVILLLLALVAYLWLPDDLGRPGSAVIIMGIGMSLIANYLMRDLVFSWRPFRIYRDPGHFNIVPIR